MIFPEFYASKTGKFFKNYMVEDLYYCKIDPFFNDWKAAKYLANKCFYDQWYFKGVNRPETIARRVNGLWAVTNGDETQFITKEKAYELFTERTCFVKPATSSGGGRGVERIEKGTSVSEIKRVVDSLNTDIIVQEAIVQSDEMSKLNPHSVNTIRALSFLDKEGNVKVYSVIVRMGINESFVDNASSGGIMCGVETDGRLKPVAYSGNGTRYDSHPSTGLKFNDVVIPNYDKIAPLIQKLHKEFPHFRLLSWDIAIDKNDEPMLVEVNLCYGGLWIHQLNNGPLFGDDTNKILDEVFGKD